MGVTAENVAARYEISRDQQDAFAALSQQRAEAAQAADKFSDEIVPVPIQVKKETVLFDRDEYPRSGVTAEALAKLPAAFMKDGTVTAANASGINDGAAAIVVMSAEKAAELGLTAMVRWQGSALAGVEPEVMGIGPVYATQKLLKRLNLSVADLDLVEANEAFAAQCLAVGKQLGWDPVGASGCRILVTLLYEMQRRSARRGLATLCIGGGMGVATVVEAIK